MKRTVQNIWRWILYKKLLIWLFNYAYKILMELVSDDILRFLSLSNRPLESSDYHLFQILSWNLFWLLSGDNNGREQVICSLKVTLNRVLLGNTNEKSHKRMKYKSGPSMYPPLMLLTQINHLLKTENRMFLAKYSLLPKNMCHLKLLPETYQYALQMIPLTSLVCS